MGDPLIILKTLLTLCAVCDKKLFRVTSEKNLVPIYTEDSTLLGHHDLYRYFDDMF